jgi:omega-6 fatty acid desaturase (delta-12 desaturase)
VDPTRSKSARDNTYEPWRTEHAWHHTHQGQLDVRGIDRVNSPMTVEEAARDRAAAAQRARLIKVATVFVLGAYSLVIKRKRLGGFFHYRPGFRWRIADHRAQVRGFWITVIGHVGVHAFYVWALGWRGWVGIVLPAFFLGAGFGALLFWVQHNFERTYHASGADWSYYRVGVEGSSYLALPPLLRFWSADIGLHHVHHLHPRIPCYRLEEARRAVPALAAVPPLSGRGFLRCFTHVFWDPARGRMVAFDELLFPSGNV